MNADERLAEQQQEFLDLIRRGVGQLNAAIQVGWTPAKLRRLLKEESFADLVFLAEESLIEDIEEAVYTAAKAGNSTAYKMVLYNRRPDKWRDVRHIQVEKSDRLEVDVVVGVKEGILASLREGGIAALQPGGVLDAVSTDITEVEPVEAD